jgi:hypothetical protein
MNSNLCVITRHDSHLFVSNNAYYMFRSIRTFSGMDLHNLETSGIRWKYVYYSLWDLVKFTVVATLKYYLFHSVYLFVFVTMLHSVIVKIIFAQNLFLLTCLMFCFLVYLYFIYFHIFIVCIVEYNKSVILWQYINYCLLLYSGPGSSVGIATGYGLDGPGIRGARIFAHVQTGPGAHQASCAMGTGSFPGVKRPGRGADHPPSPSAEVENE